MNQETPIAVVAGIGPGLGRALCRQLLARGYRVAGLARSPAASEDLDASAPAGRYLALRGDLADPAQVDTAIAEVESQWGHPAVYVHNAAPFLMQAFLETEPSAFETLWRTTCLGAVHGAQRVLPGMLQSHRGTLLFVGATASVKAGASFAAFGSAKFALRGLAQSLARELGPEGIHVAHLIIDGIIWSQRTADQLGLTRAQCLDPDAVARSCMHLIEQDRSTWTHELDLRPHLETF